MNKIQVADKAQYQSSYFDIELLGHVAHIKLNRPEKRNAMNWDFWRDLPLSLIHISEPTRPY